MPKYEVFNPFDGRPRYRVPFAWVAWLIARFSVGLDWAPAGEGWACLSREG